MKKSITALILVLGLLLSGCSWLEGSYVSVTPHQEQRQISHSAVISADNYLDLMAALEDMIASGTESAAIIVSDFPANAVSSGMAMAVRYVMENDPIGAYAVDAITYELGSSAGQPAVAVNIQYRHSRAEIRQIYRLKNMDETESVVEEALREYSADAVMLVEDYSKKDFTQFVEDYAEANPQIVMELPQVAVGVYGTGQTRVVELIFSYQTARDSLRQMQAQVKTMFDSASMYVSGEGSDWQKYSQLYGFLMERFDYQVETSITPAYSLLRHGVGDSRAFAVVYAAMCRAAGLECMIVTGTKSGEPWTWNLVKNGNHYYHVDLLRSNEAGRYIQHTDPQMQGYVWDYSAYPACVGAATVPTETETAVTEETASDGT